MAKKRLMLLLDEKTVREIKSKAALAGLTSSEWIIKQLRLDTDNTKDKKEAENEKNC